LETYRNFVGGEWVASRAGETVPNLNPGDTRDLVGLVPCSTAEEARAAVEAAARAQKAWRKVPAPERGRVVARARAAMERRKEEIARALAREEGKTLKEARGEVQKTLNLLEYFSGEGLRAMGETFPSEIPNTFCYTVRQPLGVVAAITPWNFPVSIPSWKIAPALVTGNAVVLKAAEQTPWTAELVVRCFEEGGVPPGVLNLVHGLGPVVGQALIDDPRVAAVSFTGSNEVGHHIYRRGAEGLKRVQCEMGGKNPVVVLADADLALAAEGTAQGAFGSTGQRCTATSRAIVEEAVADRFVALVRERAERLRAGPGLDERSEMGPSIDEAQLAKVIEYMGVGRAEGAAVLCGGARLTEGDLAHGYFPAPTLLDRVRTDMRVAREEIFGPVLSVIRVRDFDEALAAANAVPYGLTSSIYTGDVARWHRFVEEIETGITHLNSPTMGGEPQLPFGGMKATGIGNREMGRAAIDFFTEVKAVYADYTGRKRESNVY